MISRFSRAVAGWLLAATAMPLAAQAQLQPVQTIALGTRSALAGTLRLPNRNVLLLLTDAVTLDIKAQCLAPNGQTLWTTTLNRYQRPVESRFGLLDMRRIAIGQTAREDKQLRKDKLAAQLYPTNVFTDGNTVVFAERFDEDAIKKLPKEQARQFKEGQTYVQRLDEQGRLTQHLFDPRPAPESKKTEAVALGRYADASGYVEVVRETNKREETLTFCTMHYDLGTKTVRRAPLELPATPEHISGLTSFKHFYQEWAFLGHLPNRTYFCRRTLVNGPKEKAGKQPLVYQVYLADDKGAPAGGFSTTLGLNPGTIPVFSGAMPNPGELNHIPNYFTQSQGKNSYVTYDEWEVSSGGIGSFYLDHDTGDVLIYGEYGEGDLPDLSQNELMGFFERRYAAADGRVLAAVQGPYSAAMRAKKQNRSFKGHYYRQTRFHLDPLSGQSQFSFSPLRIYGNAEDFDLLMDRDLKPLRYDYLSGKDKDERTYTTVYYPQPFLLATTFNSTDEIRIFEHAAKDDLPVYGALEKLRRPTGPSAADHVFYLAATGASTGLVVEQKQGLGGQLQVYSF